MRRPKTTAADELVQEISSCPACPIGGLVMIAAFSILLVV